MAEVQQHLQVEQLSVQEQQRDSDKQSDKEELETPCALVVEQQADVGKEQAVQAVPEIEKTPKSSKNASQSIVKKKIEARKAKKWVTADKRQVEKPEPPQYQPIVIKKLPGRSGPMTFEPNEITGSTGLTFSVYAGNFPNVVREALALRRFPDGRPIWSEVKADTDNIMAMDLVWKPVGFVRAHGYDMMAKRCAEKPGRPLAYSHFDNIQILSTKPGLIRTLKEYYGKTEAFKRVNFTYTRTMAISFVVPGTDCLASEELRELKKLFKKVDKKQLADEPLPAKQLEKNFWIVKPENENRGRGIELATSFKELVATLMRKQGDAFIVQKYIERPLLYQGRKFDIRVLAVIDNDRNFYLYKPCYLRTSSEPYTLDNQSKYIHLTNNCFQLHSDNYQKHEADNQIPYCAFLEYLDQLGPEYADIDKDHIMQRMKDIMIDCHLAAVGNLDLRKRPGYKLEIVGFDFLLDEDLRVWLIEVNTCPYMGPVLTDQQPHFMRDLLNDTFKLTLDPLYLGRTLSPEEIESETEYELLCSGDQKVNKRSTYGLEVNAATGSEGEVVDANDGQAESHQPSYLASWNQEFAASLYPSKMLHQRLMASQQHYHEKWIKQQRDEQQQLQRMAKVRTAKYSQAAPSQGAHGSSATHAGAYAAGLAEMKANKMTYQQRQAAQLQKAQQDKQDRQAQLPRGESIKLKVLKTNGSINSKPEPPSGSGKRSRSALGGGAPRPTMKTSDPATVEQADSRESAAVNPSAVEAEDKSIEQAAGTQQAHRGQRRREHHPSPAMALPNLQEQVAQALQANLGPQHYMSNALTKNWQQQDSQRKTFCRLFNLVAAHLGSSDKNAQSQGLSALSSIASSHFVLFLQEKEQLQKLFVLLRPRHEKKANTEEGKPQSTDTEAQVHVKLAQCIAHLCQQQVHHGFRSAILESRSIFNKAQKSLMEALANESKEEALPYLKLFLVICAGPEPGLPSKGQARSKPRRAVYIPGETQEQRRLKAKSIQNGSIVTAQLLQARYPEHAALVTRYLESMDDHDFVKSFLYFVNSLEAAVASYNQGIKANAAPASQLELQGQESTELARLDSQASQQTDGETRPVINSCSPEAQQRLRVMHEYFIQDIAPTEAFKQLKYEAEKQAKTATKTQLRWANTFPSVLIQELTKSTDSFFDLEYLKTQFQQLSGLFEKKQKQHIQNQDQMQPGEEKGQSKTHIQGPAGQALKDIMKNNHALMSQSPTRSQHTNQPAMRINQSTSYRGTLINQLKKGKLIPREQLAQRSDVVKEEMGALGQSNQVKFLRDPNLDLGAVKEYSGLSSRAGSTAFKASMVTRMMGPHHVKTKAQMGSETGVKGKKRPGKSYQSQQRASGVIRVSIAAQDIDCSGILSAEVANAPFSSLSVPFSSLSGEQVLQTVNQNANRSPRAAEQKARPTDLNLQHPNQNQNEEDSAPALASPSLLWQNSQTQKTNLLYAPMLAPLAQKQAQGSVKPESTVDYGHSHPEPIKLTKDESAHLPHLAALPGRPQLPPTMPLNQNTLIRNADSHNNQIHSLKESSKKTRPPASNFIDQYVQVAHAARAGLIKNKKASNKLNEDYKKALKVLNEMQQNLDARAQNPSAYCPNLQPYLQNIASNLSSARNDKAFMAQQLQTLGANQKSLKSMKTLTKSDSETSVHAAQHSTQPRPASPNQSPYLEKQSHNSNSKKHATHEDEDQKANAIR